MALSLNKVVNELVKVLKKEKPKDSKDTYWRILIQQLLQEQTWDEELLNGIKSEVGKWLEGQSNKTVKELWENSETALEEYGEESDPELETMIVDLKDEILDLILERAEEENPKDDFFPVDNDEFELDDNIGDTDFLNDDFDDDFDDDYLNDDQY